MPDNNKQNMISVSEDEIMCIAAYFMTGSSPQETSLDAFKAAESAVYQIAERIVNKEMAENGASLAMETKTFEGNIIQLPISKKW